MQEFSSISVSSYEAGSLAERLTEQSRDGWSVVSIVPTGSSVTAYLSRDAGGTDDADAPAAATASAAMLVGDAADDAVAGPADAPAAPESTESPATDTGAATTATEPVDEPAGWASSTSDDSTDAAAPAAEVAATPSAPSDAGDTAATSAGGAAPAGWYADPSSRFELRYWDGSQWTEHVSRAGQQYTDPPIA